MQNPDHVTERGKECCIFHVSPAILRNLEQNMAKQHKSNHTNKQNTSALT